MGPSGLWITVCKQFEGILSLFLVWILSVVTFRTQLKVDVTCTVHILVKSAHSGWGGCVWYKAAKTWTCWLGSICLGIVKQFWWSSLTNLCLLGTCERIKETPLPALVLTNVRWNDPFNLRSNFHPRQNERIIEDKFEYLKVHLFPPNVSWSNKMY